MNDRYQYDDMNSKHANKGYGNGSVITWYIWVLHRSCVELAARDWRWVETDVLSIVQVHIVCTYSMGGGQWWLPVSVLSAVELKGIGGTVYEKYGFDTVGVSVSSVCHDLLGRAISWRSALIGITERLKSAGNHAPGSMNARNIGLWSECNPYLWKQHDISPSLLK